MTRSKGIKGRGFKVDLTGAQYGRLTVVEFAGTTKNRQALWRCLCECGKTHVALGNRLKSGKTRSCGCYQQDRIRARSVRHGMSASAEYRIYKGMLNRCYNSNVRAYPNYGGRGIEVCDRWRFGEGGHSGFECFFADMGPRPSAGHSLERRDGDLGYTPSNVRWATDIVQANNTRRNRIVCVADEYVTVAEAARYFDAPGYQLVINRLNTGWDQEAAVLAPKGMSELEWLRLGFTWSADHDAAYLPPGRRSQSLSVILHQLRQQRAAESIVVAA